MQTFVQLVFIARFFLEVHCGRTRENEHKSLWD